MTVGRRCIHGRVACGPWTRRPIRPGWRPVVVAYSTCGRRLHRIPQALLRRRHAHLLPRSGSSSPPRPPLAPHTAAAPSQSCALAPHKSPSFAAAAASPRPQAPADPSRPPRRRPRAAPAEALRRPPPTARKPARPSSSASSGATRQRRRRRRRHHRRRPPRRRPSTRHRRGVERVDHDAVQARREGYLCVEPGYPRLDAQGSAAASRPAR